jgi:hypothetical protein
MKTRILTCAVTVLLAAFSLFPLRQIQAGIHPEPTKKVVLKITYPDGVWALASTIEGRVIRVERNGQAYAFTPFVRNADKGVVEVVFSKISRGNGGDSFEEIAHIFITSKLPSATITNPSFSIELVSIDKAPEKSSSTGASFQPAKYSVPSTASTMRIPEGCCVTCNGTTVCSGCAVVMSCDSCCTDMCCKTESTQLSN